MTAYRPVRISVFCEDRGHELFVRALVRRLAAELEISTEVEFRSSSGGHGPAVTELRAFQHAMKTGRVVGAPDLLIVLIDGNDHGWQARRQTLVKEIDRSVFPTAVVGCPDPYVERWCLIDLHALKEIGAVPPPSKGTYKVGGRAVYKKQLREALTNGDIVTLTDEMEVAPDIVEKMNLRQGAIQDPSLAAFVGDLRRVLKAHKT